QGRATALLKDPADRRLAQPEAVEEGPGYTPVVALREAQQDRFFQALVHLDRRFHLLVGFQRTFLLGFDITHTGHLDWYTLGTDANRTGIVAPAPVASVEGLIAAVACPAEAADLVFEDLACQKAGQFGVVHQQMQLDIETPAEHLLQAFGQFWRK